MRAAGQITLQMQVDRSRRVCESVARGETDVAIVGGEVPSELCDILQVLHIAFGSPCTMPMHGLAWSDYCHIMYRFHADCCAGVQIIEGWIGDSIAWA